MPKLSLNRTGPNIQTFLFKYFQGKNISLIMITFLTDKTEQIKLTVFRLEYFSVRFLIFFTIISCKKAINNIVKCIYLYFIINVYILFVHTIFTVSIFILYEDRHKQLTVFLCLNKFLLKLFCKHCIANV